MCKRTKTAQGFVNVYLKAGTTREEVATKLGVNSANIYNLMEKGKLSSSLDAAMIAIGWLEPKPTRTRLAIDCDEATRQWFRDEAARREMSGEAFLLYMREVLGWRKG